MASVLSTYQEALRLLGEARLATATDDVESRYALDDAWDEAIVYVLRQAPWRFALKTESITGAASGLIPGYTYSFTKPSGWLRTHAIFVQSGAREYPLDLKEQEAKWFANTSPLVVRYVSDAYDDPSTWTEHFAKALAAYLAFSICDKVTGDPQRTGQMFELWQSVLGEAIAHDAIPESPWLPYQLDGSFIPSVRFVLEQGLWRFAVKTVELSANASTPSSGYAYAFDRPVDWLRTVRLYKANGGASRDLDYREEGGDFHANQTPIVLRYLSKTLGDNPINWSDAFETAVLAYLGWRRALGNPNSPGAVIEARRIAFDASLKNARIKDDMRERPKINTTGRFVRSRWSGPSNSEQGR